VSKVGKRPAGRIRRSRERACFHCQVCATYGGHAMSCAMKSAQNRINMNAHEIFRTAEANVKIGWWQYNGKKYLEEI
jgi:hypothetical protein